MFCIEMWRSLLTIPSEEVKLYELISRLEKAFKMC